MPFQKIEKIRADLAQGDSVALYMHGLEMRRWLGGIEPLLDVTRKCYQAERIDEESKAAIEAILRDIEASIKPV